MEDQQQQQTSTRCTHDPDPLTPAEFAATARALEDKQGITLTGDEGKITKMGVTAGYQYAEGLLRVTILDKPFFVTTEYCEEQLKAWLNHPA